MDQRIETGPARQCVYTVAGNDLGRESGESVAGLEIIGGLRSVKVSIRQPDTPAMDSWYALDHGCALVQQEISYTYRDSQGNSVAGLSTKRLQSFTEGPPDPAFFDVPHGYEELPPSQFNARVVNFLHGDPRLSSNPAADAAEDKKYWEQRP